MKKHLPWILALPLLCTPIQATLTPPTYGTEEPPRVIVGIHRKHRKPRHQRKVKRHIQLQAKCIGFHLPRSFEPFYYIKSIGADGETLVTTDETVWSIAPSSTQIALRWPKNSSVFISPSKWYSKYDYYLTNTATSESVNAKLAQGPFLQYAVFISQIDPYRRTLALSNGLEWQVDGDPNFAYWQVGQAVLLGINNGWTGGTHILININENSYLTATKLY